MIGESPAHSEGGFTLVETLIGLVILAISSGVLIQSIALASRQIKSSRDQAAAEYMALSILAEHMGGQQADLANEGVDGATGLFWRYSRQVIARNYEEEVLSGVDSIEVEIRQSAASATLYRLKTLAMHVDKP